MKITCAWGLDPNEPGDPLPRLIAAFDSATEEDWGCTPDFYKEDIEKNGRGMTVRECTFAISEDFLDGLFRVPEGKAVNVQPKETPA